MSHESPAAEPAVQQFAKLLEDAWELDLQESPLFATNVGDTRFNHLLPGEAVADQKRRFAAKQQLQQRLAAIDRTKLPTADRLNYDIYAQQLRDDLAEFEFATYLVPITNRSGFHISFPELPRESPLNNVRDYEHYIARLTAFDRYARDHIELLRAGLQAGNVLPSVAMDGWENSVDSHIVDDPEKSLLFAPLQKFPESIPAADRERLANAAREAIAKHVVVGYREFREFLAKEYVPACRGTIGASALPRGREFYRHRVRMFTTLDLSPEEVHQTGIDEVKRIRGEMDAIIQRVGFRGDFGAFVRHLREESKFYVTTPEQLQEKVALILKRMDGELPRLFKTLPRTPYGLREIPAFIAPRTTSAYYQPPAGDGTRGGFYYINTFNLKSRPLFEMEALSLHEAVPGHHLQLALQQEMTDLPKFRRFTNFTAYIEGWALYAERLGLEVGFYTDPYSDFGRLSFEMWRACRLVVDTGMHALGWTRQQAIDYMAANTALSMHNIRAEVDRYISWPGQALAYKIGELKIRELRRWAEGELKERFDVREFHEVVLASGSVPLTVLEANVKAFVNK